LPRIFFVYKHYGVIYSVFIYLFI